MRGGGMRWNSAWAHAWLPCQSCLRWSWNRPLAATELSAVRTVPASGGIGEGGALGLGPGREGGRWSVPIGPTKRQPRCHHPSTTASVNGEERDSGSALGRAWGQKRT